MLNADVVILESFGFSLRDREKFIQPRRQIDRVTTGAADLRQPAQDLFQLLMNLLRV